jgi:hypothetical protein
MIPGSPPSAAPSSNPSTVHTHCPQSTLHPSPKPPLPKNHPTPSPTLFFFSSPPMMRSIAVSKSTISTASLDERAATRAASLQTLAMSAPLKPGVRAARRSE